MTKSIGEAVKEAVGQELGGEVFYVGGSALVRIPNSLYVKLQGGY
jgi:hypothetical protein